MRVLGTVFLACALVVPVFATQAVAQPRGQEEDWDNAPKVVPRTTEAMQTPEFWINRVQNPDIVVLTPDQIVKLNERNTSLPPTIKDINGDDYSIDNVINSKLSIGLQYNVERPLTMKTFPGDSLMAMLNRHKDYFTGRTFYERRQMKFPEDDRDRIIDNMNIEAVPSVVVARYGILVRQTLNRVVPTNQVAFGSARSWLDMLQSTGLDLGMPVAVLHASKDRTWYYVRSEIAFGWVPAENVALGDAKTLADYDNSKEFVVSLDYDVPVYGDRGFENYLEKLIIGSRVKLARQSSAGYQVIMPIRKTDGTFDTAEGWIKPDAKVSAGWQPFTQRNVITTMFNLLYRPYGWADSHHEFDCCGAIRVVLRTFGIKTGRWTSYELHAAPQVVAFPRKTEIEKKYELIKGCDPGICLVGSAGHINMYLGEVDGRHYVIHQGGYSYKGEDGKTYHFRRVNVNDTELDGGSNIRDWTEISTFKP